MEPKTQVEIQLGHMCNNRCVFCVSGQQTALGRARPLEVGPILERVTEARRAGHRKITLLGGEPTLQPGFLKVVEHAVALGFDEIVIFTNGVKTAREGFIDEVVRTGGNLTWRISIQGATEEAHDRTTRRAGSFGRILQSMGHLRRRNQRVTVNMCVVGSNYESVEHFPRLIAENGVQQLHLDMVRPMDAGERTDDEFRQMMVRYTDLLPPLTKLAAGVPEGFDLNIGNLPYCIAPGLAPFIHHDGETTHTIAVDGENELSRPWNKYEVKRRDKSKPERCGRCVFDRRCNGIFDRYREIHGDAELVPVTAEQLAELDAKHRLLSVHLAPRLAVLAEQAPPAPFTAVSIAEASERAVHVSLDGEDALVLSFHEPGGGAASLERFAIDIVRLPQSRVAARAGLSWIWEQVRRLGIGGSIRHPLGHDAVPGEISPVIAGRLSRLRRAAPHGALEWRALAVLDGGRRAELELVTREGERASFWLEDRNGKATAGYEVSVEKPSEALVHGLGAIFATLSPQPRARQPGTAG